MIKLKNIFNEGVYGKFWWMDSHGNLIDVHKPDALTGHHQVASDILKQKGILPEKDIFGQMYKLGWIRVGFKGDGGEYTLDFNCGFGKSPSLRQLKSLKDLAIEMDATELRDSSNRKSYEI